MPNGGLSARQARAARLHRKDRMRGGAANAPQTSSSAGGGTSDGRQARVAAARVRTADWQDALDKAALFGGADDLNDVTALYVAGGGDVIEGIHEKGDKRDEEEAEDGVDRAERAKRALIALRNTNAGLETEHEYKFVISEAVLLYSGPCQTAYNTAACEAVAPEPDFPLEQPRPVDPPRPRRLPPKLRLQSLQMVPQRSMPVKQAVLGETDMGDNEAFVIPEVKIQPTQPDARTGRVTHPKKRARAQNNSKLNLMYAEMGGGGGGGNGRKRVKRTARRPVNASTCQLQMD